MSTLERTLIATQVRLERAQNELLDREKDLAAAVAKCVRIRGRVSSWGRHDSHVCLGYFV